MEITNIKPLYRYENADGSISITPNKRNEGDTIHGYRLIADEGCELYHNGENTHASVIDVQSVDGWTQEPIPTEPSEEDATEQDYLNALNELGVKTDEESNA